jgi:hypothetical protein
VPDEEFVIDQFFEKRLYLKEGDNYEDLTYPKFFNNENGDLFLTMRKGGNNNGKYMFAKYHNSTWESFRDFNILSAKEKGADFNWGLYGDFKFLNGKMRIGFHIRKNDDQDQYKYNNGFYYAYADDPIDFTNWKNYKGENIDLPLIPPDKLFISEPGNEVTASGVNSVVLTSGADWTVTQNGSIHFTTAVTGKAGTKEVHTYKKAGDADFTTTTDFPSGSLESIGDEIFLVGLDNGKPIIYKAKGGTNDLEKIYEATSGKKFKHGVVHISERKLFYYLMEDKSGSAQPIYLQIYDL